MKALSSITKKTLTLLLAIVLCFTAFACQKKTDSSNSSGNSSSSTTPAKPAVTIAIESDKDSLKVGEEVTLTVVVTNAEDQSYTWSVSEEDLKIVQIADNVLTVKEDAEILMDRNVVLTATSTEDPSAKATKTIKVIAPVVEGRVGELTSEMIEEIGNPSITVTGTVTDVFFNNRNSYLSSNTVYDVKVEMEEGKWTGSFNHQNSTNVLTDSYRKGAKDGVKDGYGNVGHQMEKIYINKDNEVATTIVKDYNSHPAVWEAQHLWNHLANLNVNKFTYNPENGLYVYSIDEKSAESEWYLMTYLAYCLTPMLEETFTEIAFTVESGEISSFIGKTERVYSGLTDDGDFDAYAETIVEVVFSNIGSTTVSDPTPYEAPAHAEKLEAALEEMQNATNYTFSIVDNQLGAPSVDDSEYMGINVGAIETKGVNTAPSSVGVVGTMGLVTEDKILFCETGKYNYAMDDKLYHFNYTGYVQNDDGTYDYFETSNGLLVGKRKYTGSMFNSMPTFDLSANVFRYAGTSDLPTGFAGQTVPVLKFVLRSSEMTREVAMEISTEGKDAGALSSAELIIYVTNIENEYHIYQTQVPYDLVYGTYTGTYVTTFQSLGTTTIPEEYFVDYVPRVIPKTWAETITKYYQINYTGNSFEENTQTVFDAVYGDKAKDIPSPEVFFEMFGDSMNGPFYDWKETDKVDSDGNAIKTGWVGINITADESWLDDNAKIIDFEACAAYIDEIFVKYGYQKSPANCDISGGASGNSSRWLTYVKEGSDIMVVIENNHTKYFFIDFYKVGDWTLDK